MNRAELLGGFFTIDVGDLVQMRSNPPQSQTRRIAKAREHTTDQGRYSTIQGLLQHRSPPASSNFRSYPSQKPSADVQVGSSHSDPAG